MNVCPGALCDLLTAKYSCRGFHIAVADVFEALSHPRTYRSPYATFDALEQVVSRVEVPR